MKRLLLLVTLACGIAPAAQATEDDVLIAALRTWAERSVAELAIAEGAEPQRSVFAVLEQDEYYADALFGSIESESGHLARPTRVEVVVGDDALNSSRYRSSDRLPQAIQRYNLVPEDVPLALERDLWLAADSAYKASVQRWMFKTAARAAQGGETPPPDWTPAEPRVSIEAVPELAVDRDGLREIACTASARLKGIEGLRGGWVEVRELQGRYVLVTSDGTTVVRPEGYAVVYAWADLLRDDGLRIADHRQWVVRTAADLPPVEDIADEVERMGRTVAARAAAEVVDYYEGPVVFEGRAAAEFFRYLVPEQVCGTPPAPEAGKTYEALTRSGPRLGRRLLPQGWNVTDDPTRAVPGLAGGFTVDREGIPAQPVTLVQDGYVRDLLMSRTPRRELQVSNGHARGAIQGDWDARLSVWEVQAQRNLSARAFDKQVDKVMKAANLDHILVVRGLWESKAGHLPKITDAVWRSADGTERPVQALSFEGASRRTLRDIVAAGGGQQTTAYLDAYSLGRMADDDEGLPTVLVSPTMLLVDEVEAVFPGPDDTPHAYPPPPLTP